MYYLTHTAKEIDEKIKRIPLATSSESTWKRTDDWTYIADQEYNKESAFAQSGKAVAAAIEASLEVVDGKLTALQSITQDEIIRLFDEE